LNDGTRFLTANHVDRRFKLGYQKLWQIPHPIFDVRFAIFDENY